MSTFIYPYFTNWGVSKFKVHVLNHYKMLPLIHGRYGLAKKGLHKTMPGRKVILSSICLHKWCGGDETLCWRRGRVPPCRCGVKLTPDDSSLNSCGWLGGCLMSMIPANQLWMRKTVMITNLWKVQKKGRKRKLIRVHRIPGTEEPGGLPSMGSHRVRHDWSDLAAAAHTTSI